MTHATTLKIYNPPQTPHLEVIYQDEAFLVLNKPSGLLSVPGKNPDHNDSLLTRAEQDFPDSLLVHRLDMETSGVFLMARSKSVQKHIGLQFEKRRTRKTYVACVSGHLKEDSGTVDLPLICDWPNRPRQKVDHEGGKPAQTHWRCLTRDQQKHGGIEFSRIELTPITGRSHQLRVHMQALGHPILGDPFYADEPARNAADRLLLHAERLSVMHPNTQKFIEFKAPSPF